MVCLTASGLSTWKPKSLSDTGVLQIAVCLLPRALTSPPQVTTADRTALWLMPSSAPTSANQEDHVSMATFAARRLHDMAANTATVVMEYRRMGDPLPVWQPLVW